MIGAGFMGLATGLALAEKGVDVAVIEAAEIGWGAYGRNNSLLPPQLKRDPRKVRKILGLDAAEQLLAFSSDAPNIVSKLAQRLGIECDLRLSGWIQAAHSKRAVRLLERRVREWRDLGADVEMIDAGGLPARLGTDYYAGASLDPRGGSLNPLAFVRGLAVSAEQAGTKLFERTPAIDI